MVPVVERYAVRDKVEVTVEMYEGYKQTSCPAEDSTGSPQVVTRAIVRVSVRATGVSVVVSITIVVVVAEGTKEYLYWGPRSDVGVESVAITVSLPQLSVVVGPGI
jgi:hypothetical protein